MCALVTGVQTCALPIPARVGRGRKHPTQAVQAVEPPPCSTLRFPPAPPAHDRRQCRLRRSEERPVGKKRVSACRSGGPAYYKNKNNVSHTSENTHHNCTTHNTTRVVRHNTENNK